MPQRHRQRRRRLCAVAIATLAEALPIPTASGFHTSSDHLLISKPASHVQGLQLHDSAPGATDGSAAIASGGRSTCISRRDILKQSATAVVGAAATLLHPSSASATAVNPATADGDARRSYVQQFPTLFDPLYGKSSRQTIIAQLSQNMWSLEQSLVLGPLETPLRCIVVKLADNTLWVHAPLAPTEEFFDMVESCASVAGGSDGGVSSGVVAHVVCPTYALEHKIFVKDALKRWPNAKLWVAPGQFSFPIRSASDDIVWGRSVSGTLQTSDLDDTYAQPPWTGEIQYETLAGGTFDIGGVPTTLYETAFFHRPSKTLIVTDSVAKVSLDPPPLNQHANLLLISKRSTSDPMPEDTAQARKIGWEKTALLISYFFPEHEEPDPDKLGVVTWTDGWHDNFEALAGRLIVPPVVRTLLYAQDPKRVKSWVNRVASRWNFDSIVPAHWDAPIAAGPEDFQKAFRFLDDSTIDPFPENDLKRGLKPIADIALKTLAKKE
jgi:hypothetical protein